MEEVATSRRRDRGHRARSKRTTQANSPAGFPPVAIARGLRTASDDSLLAARAHDGLADVKHASDDYAGAARDLRAAITIWRMAQQRGEPVDAAYLARREEDLAGIEGVIRVRSRRPPELIPRLL